ncbi:UNKNOWN [Stylonychia lemnae]|uniref:Uncharacterized protein n=1 Tax=Stylonychia lemnae TaxID=5949 RepID=A0A078AVL4_STYLE|nr:UNKNOWN [Stylonychia lemnae]|eukprot:CDW86111.1 UNKNOWN [Stylonychia lemnae]
MTREEVITFQKQTGIKATSLISYYYPIMIQTNEFQKDLLLYDKESKEFVPNLIQQILKGVEIETEAADENKKDDQNIIDL